MNSYNAGIVRIANYIRENGLDKVRRRRHQIFKDAQELFEQETLFPEKKSHVIRESENLRYEIVGKNKTFKTRSKKTGRFVK